MFEEKHVGEVPGFVRKAGFSIRVGLSTLTLFGWLAFLILWLFFYADDYSSYQNLAIFIVSLLVLGAVSGSTWLFHWMRAWRRRA